MSVDWITVAAQIVNFLVLVWLLKRFLYRPILDGIDAREAEIAKRMDDAAASNAAAQARESEYRTRVAALEASTSTIADDAQRKAEAERDAILNAARERAEQERKDLIAYREKEAGAYAAALNKAGAGAILAQLRRALDDLADETLEDRMARHTADSIRDKAAELRQAAGSDTQAVVTTRDPLLETAQEALRDALAEVLPDAALQFETDPGQSPGLVLRLGGARLDWTIDSYVDQLATHLLERLAAGSQQTEQADGR